MRNSLPGHFQFENTGKFALLAVSNVYTGLMPSTFQLSDGTWVMPSVPVSDVGTWNEWIGSIRMKRLQKANLVLLVEEASDNPGVLDAVHQHLGRDLSRLFYMVHLRSGIECRSADLLCGSSEQGAPSIRQIGQLATFYQSKGYRRMLITEEWLEDAVALRGGLSEAERVGCTRVIRGLNTLFRGLKEEGGQDRLHQFVRSLEALILPDIGETKKQFMHRCQTFARAGNDTRSLLKETFDMRSNTEHLHSWDEAVRNYQPDQREDVCWRRTRQIEHLACDAYSRVLRHPELRNHFRSDDAIAAFWKLPDDQRRELWGKSVDITSEP